MTLCRQACREATRAASGGEITCPAQAWMRRLSDDRRPKSGWQCRPAASPAPSAGELLGSCCRSPSTDVKRNAAAPSAADLYADLLAVRTGAADRYPWMTEGVLAVVDPGMPESHAAGPHAAEV
jgi:hypothetical protein